MELYDYFAQAAASTQRIIDKVTSDHGNRSTPCAEWTVDDLIQHVFAVSGRAKAMAAGIDVVADGSIGDPVGEDLTTSYRESVASVRRAFGDRAIFDTLLTTPMGPYPGRVVFTVTSIEHLIHGWDLAAAIGVPFQFDPDVIERSFQAISDMPDVFANFRTSGAYSPPLTAGDDAGPAVRLLAELGRDAAWRNGADR